MPKSVCFAVPSLTHSVSMEFFTSAMQTGWDLALAGYQVSWINVCGDQFIAKARNKLVWDFLQNHPDCQNLFFLDDDLGWTPHKVVEFLERDEDIVVGVYPKKSDEPDWPVMIKGEDGKLEERDGLVRVLRAPTGFMRIKRRVFETLLPYAVPFKEFSPSGVVSETPGFFFAGVAPDGWFWTEDYIFSENVTQAGFEIWCDPHVEFTHRGHKAWKGTLKDDLHIFRSKARKAHRQRLKQMKASAAEIIEGEIVDGDFRSDAA